MIKCNYTCLHMAGSLHMAGAHGMSRGLFKLLLFSSPRFISLLPAILEVKATHYYSIVAITSWEPVLSVLPKGSLNKLICIQTHSSYMGLCATVSGA